MDSVLSKRQDIWSDNTAAGFFDARYRCVEKLREVINHIERGSEGLAEERFNEAIATWNESIRWLNTSNLQRERINALVSEVKANRSGSAVTYPVGDDPINEDWRNKS